MADNPVTGSIQSRKDYKKTPTGQYKYWDQELKASEKNLRKWREEGTKIVRRYTGGSRNSRDSRSPDARSGSFRLNLFHSNTIVLQSMLYGNLPKVEVSRRYNDPNDDVGRVAALIMERLLNNDVQDHPEMYNSTLKAALQDRLLPGLGVAKVRYEYNEETNEENAPTEYHHWRDVCWGWGRTFDELPWIAYRSYLEKDEVKDRWGEEAAEGVQLKRQTITPDKSEAMSPEDDGPWQKAEVWEIWDKTQKKVVWVSIGYDKVLETKDDFLKIQGFLPSPPFLLANQTTTLYTPTSDFYLAQDLYNEIDTLQTRISIITEAVKVVGVYNSSATEISRVFKEGTDNDLIPVENWALFAESGGIQGQIDWVPLADIVTTLAKLRELRDEQIALLQQVTGMSDIMRGQLDNQYEGVGQSKDKTKFGSIRIQSLQEEFALFASNLLQIKANIIGVHYEPELIAKLANTESFMEVDKELIPAAIALIKQPLEARLHIVIRPESVAMVDYAQLQAEKTQYLTAISTFMQASAPIMEKEPATTPFMLQLLQWGLTGFKGANEIEGVIDKAIQVTQDNADKQQEKPDPEQVKAQASMQLEKIKHQNSMEAEQIQHQNNMKEIQAKAQADTMELKAGLQADLQKIQAELKANMEEIVVKMKADIKTEIMTSEINVQQQSAGVQGEMGKDAVNRIGEVEQAQAISNIEIDKATKEED